jgi:Domain of unknown function (DUF3560)
MYFIRNLETNKVEIYTGSKEAWKELPSEVREHIKRYCNFSRASGDAWISKAYNPWWADKLTEWGFEDRGKEGEKLSLEERIERKQERAEARAERYEDRADKAEAQSAEHFKTFHDRMDAIPFGQPILVGHHSEKRDRNYREKACAHVEKGVKEAEKAAYYSRRAETAARTAAGAQLKNPRYLGNRIKEREADIRTYERRLEGKYYHYDAPGSHEVTEDARERYNERLEELRAELTFFQKCLNECGQTIYTKESLAGMTHIHGRYGWAEIIRLNPTSVSCVNTLYSTEDSNRKWPNKVPYAEVRDAKRVEKTAELTKDAGNGLVPIFGTKS